MGKNKFKKWFSIVAFIVFLFQGNLLMAQQRTVSGTVKDANGEPVIGATVLVKGTNIGTITDVNGKFQIKVPTSANNTLTVSYVGMKNKEVPISSNVSVVNIVMEEASQQLEDVVVIGYGTARKVDLTGAVASISAKALKDLPVASTAQALTGRLPGVNVTTTEGSPDAEILIRVRGGGSITQDNSPLYVVDGFVVKSISDIAPSDIASIDVLKDAASTAIYGAQGANGVILITTKSGKEGKVTLNFNSYVGIKKTANYIDVLNPYEYVYYQYELDQGTSFQNYYGRFQDLDIYKSDPGINWQNEVFGRTGVQQNYNLSLMGGTKDTKYNLSLNQTDEKYTMINSGYKRTNANFKINTRLNENLEFVFNTRLSYTTIDGTSVSSGSGANTKLRNVVKYAPTKGLRGFSQTVEDEDLTNTPEAASLLLDPIQSIQNEYKEQYKFNNLYNGMINWDIIKGLRFSSNVNYNFMNNRVDQVWTEGTGTSRDNGGQPVGEKDYEVGYSWGISNTLTYNFTLNHKFKMNLLAGQEILESKSESSSMLAKFFPLGKTASEVLAAMSNGTPQPIYTSIGEPNRISSFFGRANLSFADKYLLTLTAREDGASVFSPKNKWGFFPGAALAWRISEEPFLLSQKDWLSNLKIRLSYGEVGNSRVGTYWRQDYSYVNLTSTKTYYPNESIVNALVPSTTLRNPDLTWETTITQNLGLDFGVFNNRLTGTIELYKNKTKDLIVAVPLPSASGYSQQYQNVGQTSNKGVELSFDAYIVQTKDFSLSANFNISFNKNNIDRFSNGENNFKLYGSGWNGSAEPTYDYLVQEGKPVGMMYGYVTDGYYTFDDFTWNEVTKSWDIKDGVPSDAALISAGKYFGPGALKLKDISGPDGVPDGKITEDDRTIIGDANPIHVGGFGINSTYKGFDFSVFFNWSYGNDIYNANKLDFSSYLLTRKYQNLSSVMSLANRFTTIDPETGYNIYYGNYANPTRLQELNQNATIWHPIMTTTVFHSWAVEDGSFLRLNNLTLGYSLPQKIVKSLRMENLRIYATGYNLYCWTNYSGPDPEVSTRRSTPLTPGVDFSAYPKARSFVGGINVTF
jgi:TonB-linked SusC/RagA family outer membrane protein